MDMRNFGTMLGYGQGSSTPGLGQTLYSGMFGGGLPQPLTSGNDPTWRPSEGRAPVYSSAGVTQSTNTPWNAMSGVMTPGSIKQAQYNPGRMDSMLGTTLTAGGAGGIDRGAAAFLGTGYNPWSKEINSQGELVNNPNQSLADLFTTARGLGMDTSRYSNEAGGVDIRGNRIGSGAPNAMDLYNDLNNHTKDYLSVSGLTSGWSGGGPGGASRTIYKEQDGKLLPVTAPALYQNRTNNGFISRDAIQGLSMVLPAFGGWAGLLGSGTAGTLSAGSGLGLTTGLGGAIGTGATNALVNAGMAGLTGGGWRGALGSLGSAALGAAGNSVMGRAGGLADMFNTANAGASALNPMGYFNSTLGSTGLSGSPIGLISGLAGAAAGGGGINANALRQVGGSLAGSYLANRINPQLRGLGGQVGRGLANMWS